VEAATRDVYRASQAFMSDNDRQNERSSPDGGAAQPSGPKGDNPSTAGAEETKVLSGTPENAAHRINPSAPNDGSTPPSNPAPKGAENVQPQK